MRILLILIYFVFISKASYSNNHFPITRDSALMIAKGKIVYQNNCVSCHLVNLVGAENWKSLDEDVN
jgi:cytochrome c